MNRRVRILLALLILCLGVAAWQWLRPYEWGADPEARATVEFTRLKRDNSFLWLDVVLSVEDPRGHDLRKPVRLLLADGRELEPAETTLEGSPEQSIEGLSFRFWLEEDQIAGPLKLRMNDGELTIRKRSTLPGIESGESRFYQTSNW